MRRKILSDEKLIESSARAWTPPLRDDREQVAAGLERASAGAWTPPPPLVRDAVDDPLVVQSAASWIAPAAAHEAWGLGTITRAADDSIPPMIEADPFPSQRASRRSSWPPSASERSALDRVQPSSAIAFLAGLVTAFVAASVAVFVNPSPHATSLGQAVAWLSSSWGGSDKTVEGSVGTIPWVIGTRVAHSEQAAQDAPVVVDEARDTPREASTSVGVEADAKTEALRLLNEGDAQGAASRAKAAIQREPSDAKPYLVYGAALEELGRRVDAVQAYCECSRHAIKGAVLECRALCRRK